MSDHLILDKHSVVKKVNLEQLIAHMRTPKPDGINLIMRGNGTFTAICKRCQMKLQTGNTLHGGELPLVWHRCPKCQRVSFSVQDNLDRDAQIAESMGGIFPYEVYFMTDLPDELAPPNKWRVA